MDKYSDGYTSRTHSRSSRHSRSRSRSLSFEYDDRYRNRKKYSRDRDRDRSRNRSRTRSRSRSKHTRRRHESSNRRRSDRSRSRTQDKHRSHSDHRRHRKHDSSKKRSSSRSKSSNDIKDADHRSSYWEGTHTFKNSTKSTRKQKHEEMARKYINFYVNSSSSSDSEFDEDNETMSNRKTENAFKNDGSFLEMFKQMQETQQQQGEIKTEIVDQEIINKKSQPPPILLPHQRRAGKILKTGMVQKRIEPKKPDENASSEVWNLYLKEVKKYKESICDDDSNRRALIK